MSAHDEVADLAGGISVTTVALRYEDDVVLARQRARGIAAFVGMAGQDQVRFATAVSELARNAFQYARDGHVTFRITREGERSVLAAVVSDSGPGIDDLPRILQGTYVSQTGMGIGITGARRLADRFRITSAPGDGTTVAIGKVLGHLTVPIGVGDVDRITQALARQEVTSPFAELQRQNQDLIAALETVREREAEALRLGQELAETNRGVVALYAELDDRARELSRMSDYKTRFLSDVSHELRTPLSSIINLTRLLLARSDGPLEAEQEKQLEMINRSALWLADMVNELLDIAKIEAGKVELRPCDFRVDALFATLRGVLRPLATNDAVTLTIDDPPAPMTLHTDEQRVAQVLRNFVSNALKFTVAGEVRVRASAEAGGLVRFSVADTGIGIAPADRERVFQDYTQVDGPIQRRVRGTGLGLPLSRKLAAILGGRVELESEVGAGSCFSLLIPADVRGSEPANG